MKKVLCHAKLNKKFQKIELYFMRFYLINDVCGTNEKLPLFYNKN